MANDCKWAKPFKYPFTHLKKQLYICTILESVGVSSHYCFCTEETYEKCSEAQLEKENHNS